MILRSGVQSPIGPILIWPKYIAISHIYLHWVTLQNYITLFLMWLSCMFYLALCAGTKRKYECRAIRLLLVKCYVCMYVCIYFDLLNFSMSRFAFRKIQFYLNFYLNIYATALDDFTYDDDNKMVKTPNNLITLLLIKPKVAYHQQKKIDCLT